MIIGAFLVLAFVVAQTGLTPNEFGHSSSEVMVDVPGIGQKTLQLALDEGNVLNSITSPVGSGIDVQGVGSIILGVDYSEVQERVGQACGSDQAIKSINGDGTVECVDVGGVLDGYWTPKCTVMVNPGSCQVQCPSGYVLTDASSFYCICGINYPDSQTAVCCDDGSADGWLRVYCTSVG